MKNRRKGLLAILAITLTGLISSCGNAEEKQEKIEVNTVHQEESSSTEEMQIEGLVLNDGNRWEANPETSEGINTMRLWAKAFGDTENLEAYGPLRDSLMAEYKLIFKNCTMQGEAHNNLHHYLIPIKEMLNDLGSDKLSTAQEGLARLNEHLKKYEEYFE